jgi:hypothetical protein
VLLAFGFCGPRRVLHRRHIVQGTSVAAASRMKTSANDGITQFHQKLKFAKGKRQAFQTHSSHADNDVAFGATCRVKYHYIYRYSHSKNRSNRAASSSMGDSKSSLACSPACFGNRPQNCSSSQSLSSIASSCVPPTTSKAGFGAGRG